MGKRGDVEVQHGGGWLCLGNSVGKNGELLEGGAGVIVAYRPPGLAARPFVDSSVQPYHTRPTWAG